MPGAFRTLRTPGEELLRRVDPEEALSGASAIIRDCPSGDVTVLPAQSVSPQLEVFRDGGMSLIRQDAGRLLFRHADLGLPDMYGHGHADALSILFFWKNIQVLADNGSGQYNGDQSVRNYFRSTIAHNTVELGGRDQAKMLGPFLWSDSYETVLDDFGVSPRLFATAHHDGYMR